MNALQTIEKPTTLTNNKIQLIPTCEYYARTHILEALWNGSFNNTIRNTHIPKIVSDTSTYTLMLITSITAQSHNS